MNNVVEDIDRYVVDLKDVQISDVDKVGGKNASLGEMICNLSGLGVKVPGGFATTSYAFKQFLAFNNLEKKINDRLNSIDIDNLTALQEAGIDIRNWIIAGQLPKQLEVGIRKRYDELFDDKQSVAVRSSATAEDLPDASFAGQQETYLNISGIEEILLKVKEVFASLYNDRAISYRVHQHYAHHEVALSACIQQMVRSDVGASGVMFTLDTETGCSDVVFITSSYGLGETIVQGSVNPDEFYIAKTPLNKGLPAVISKSLGSKRHKMIYQSQTSEEAVTIVDVADEQQNIFSIDDHLLMQLAKHACVIEEHYQRPMDIEWAFDGIEKQLYIVQARPETVQNQLDNNKSLERYILNEKDEVLFTGAAIGNRIGVGICKILTSIQDMDKLLSNDVLVTTMTDPDWEPIMKRASAIITERGGRTCHAAIIARELGVPAIVGCGEIMHKVKEGQQLTVSCAEGEVGNVYPRALSFSIEKTMLASQPKLPIKIMMNIGNPGRAMSFAKIPNDGVGLARLEFIINNKIGIHPRALLDYEQLDSELQTVIHKKVSAYHNPIDFYVNKIIEGVATLATAFKDKPVIVRFSDFKSNEYANLLGGSLYEPTEENPMLGYRGTSRYLSEDFTKCFELECKALKFVRDEMGLTNVWLMAPFVRTIDEASTLQDLLKKYGLVRGVNDLKIMMMCEIPSNAILAEQFLEYFDGFSIGSNDMTQLTLGVDRDSELISSSFDERNEAVKYLLQRAIKACKNAGKYVGICGQGPSDHPDFAKWLLEQGIESISLNPDSVIETTHCLG